jgi:hypothetical protein
LSRYHRTSKGAYLMASTTKILIRPERVTDYAQIASALTPYSQKRLAHLRM